MVIAARVAVGISIGCCVATIIVHGWLERQGAVTMLPVVDFVLATAWPLIGVLVVGRQPRNPVGWLLVAPSLLGPYALMGHYAAASALVTPLPGAAFSAWVAMWGFAVHFYVVPLLLLVFPDGRLPSRRWRPVAIGIIVIATITTIAAMLRPGSADVAIQVVNPIGVNWPSWMNPIGFVGSSLTIGLGTLLAVASIVVRTRRAVGMERIQLQWLMLSGIVAALGVVAALLTRSNWIANEISIMVVLLAPVVGIGGAMLRHRLFDVTLVLNRTLVSLVLAAVGVGLYAAVVFGVEAIAPNSPLGVVTVAAVALLAAFGRDAVQAGVDRLLFGLRHDPYAVVSRVGRHVASAAEPVEALQRLVDAVRSNLRLPYAAFTSAAVTVTSGTPAAGWHTVAASALGQPVGELHICRRRTGERLSAKEQAAIEEVAARAGTLAYAAGLIADIAASRTRIVIAREEERRRLRADLHDGLGPTLAGLTHQMDALARRLRTDGNGELAERAQRLGERLRCTVVEVRTMAHGLQPPVLDQLGLVAALQELVAGYEMPCCTVRVDSDLGALPAALEVSAYAIAAEAVTNAVRHSAAAQVELHLTADECLLTVEVRDDGCGLPARPKAGVGLRSMGERAAELGGRLDILPAPGGGTIIRAILPRQAS
ncbi:sensor histidine kinase [Planobispora rosea]|uniref:sensor histidine kinase n=1 Tax=Planobispora rosea TaxID=35762 RepID=UPI000A070AD9|nr:ATP-binding protein [Planobispora rosea]